jgi:hypothetical protein
MQPQENTIKFEAGNVYEMSFITDSNLRPKFICVKTTSKTATFERFGNPSDKFTKKLKVWDNVEYVLEGSYSMAPRIKADKIVM